MWRVLLLVFFADSLAAESAESVNPWGSSYRAVSRRMQENRNATSITTSSSPQVIEAPMPNMSSNQSAKTNLTNSSLNATDAQAEAVAAQGVTLRFSYFIGICLSLLATIAGTYGKQSIRLSEIRKQEGKAMASRTLVVSGIFVNTAVGPILDSVAYAFAPQAVLAPFTGMDIVWNTLVAPYTLGEERTTRRSVAAALVFCGTTASVLFNVPQTREWDSAFLHAVLVRWRTLAYFVVYGLWFCWGNFRLVSLEKGSTKRGFYFGAIAGSLAGNMFCLKCLAEVVKRNLATGDWSTWTDWLTWVILVGAIFFAVTNVFYMTKGMKAYETLYMVTVYEGSNIIVNSASAIIVLGEMEGAPWWKYAGYTFCILVITLALVLLVHGEKVLKERKDSELKESIELEKHAGGSSQSSEELRPLASGSAAQARVQKPPTFALLCNGELVCSY
mmetsp:Transcript_10841/g.24566  ORF Transcript_10841/g.24566 Transcript_10841/m.24566 type:complete len:445 (-) Transcript_10841:60-1394(-)